MPSLNLVSNFPILPFPASEHLINPPDTTQESVNAFLRNVKDGFPYLLPTSLWRLWPVQSYLQARLESSPLSTDPKWDLREGGLNSCKF